MYVKNELTPPTCPPTLLTVAIACGGLVGSEILIVPSREPVIRYPLPHLIIDTALV